MKRPKPNDVIAFMDCYGSDRLESAIPFCTMQILRYEKNVMWIMYVEHTHPYYLVGDYPEHPWKGELGTDWRVIDNAVRLGVFLYD